MGGVSYQIFDQLKAENARLREALHSVRQWDSLYDALPDNLAQQIGRALEQKSDT